MKKNAIYFLSILFFFSSTIKLQSQCSLDQIGAPNFVPYSALSDMYVAPNGQVYTFAYNNNANQFQLYSAMFPGSFSLLATISTSTAVRPSIAVSKLGKVSVLIRDENAAKVAKVYYLSGGSLLQQGPAVSSGQVSDLSLAFNSAGEEYVAYTDIANANMATVKKWNGSAWVNVGSGTVSTGAAAFNSLALDKFDNPLLAYQDATTAPANKVVLKKFNGSAWIMLFTSPNPATNPKIKPAKNNTSNYYLGYTEISSPSVHVQLYNGSSWTVLGSPVANVSSNSGTFGFDVDANDLPVFTSILSTPPYPVAYKYSGGAWSSLVTYINSSTAIGTNIMFDATGTPYYFFVDQPSNNSLNVRKTTTPVSISTQPLSTTVCDGSSGFFNVTGTGSPGYQWQSLGAVGFQNVVAPFVNGTTPATSFTANPSINQYELRCVLNAGCINRISNTATLTVNSLSVTATTTNPTCFNTSNGAISTTVTGGSSPHTYTWSPIGGNAATATGLYGTTYTLTASDNIGCTTTKTITLTTPPSINSSFTGNQTFCSGSSTSMTVIASGGVGALTYSWTPSVDITPTTGSVVTMNPSSSMTYGVQITDAIGCTTTNTVGINPIAPPSISASASSSTLCAGTTITLSATGSANTYTWNPGAIIGNTIAVAPGSTTTYTATGTNTTTGCQANAGITVTVTPTPTITAGPTKSLTCAGTFTVVNAASAGAASFNWTGPGIVSGYTMANCNVNAAGVYSVFALSPEGCASPTATTSVVLNNTPPSVSANNSGPLTCATTTVNLTGTPGTGVTYLWTGPGITSGATSQNAVANAAGNYTLRVTSAVNSCTNTAVTSVTQNTLAPSPTASTTGTLTCASLTAALNGGPAAGVTYLWTGPGVFGPPTTQNTSANVPGTYTLTVTSSVNGCTNTAVTNVTQNTVPPAPTASTTGTLTCASLTAALNGGPAAGVTYLWTGAGVSGSTTSQNTFANLPGTYTLQVTNMSNGCSGNAITTVTQNTTTPSISSSSTQSITCTTSSVSLNASSSADPTTTYTWTSAFAGMLDNYNISNPNAFASGVYTVDVTNTTNGCVATNTVEVFSDVTLPVVTVSFSPSNTLTCTDITVSSIATVSDPNVSFSWLGSGIVSGASTATASINQSGGYSVTVTNTINGCASTTSVIVAQDITPPAFSVGASPAAICQGNTTTITATGATTYSWSSGQTSASITDSPSATTVYTVTGFGTNGCSSITTETVTVDNGPSLSVTGALNICKGSTASLTANGAMSYTWSTGATTASITETPTVTTTYTVSGDNGSCPASLITTVSIVTAKDITGTITSTAGATSGDLILYKYTAFLSQWDSVTTVPLTSSYSFTNIDSALYVIRAIPTATNIQVTYAGSSISWQNATVITHGCANNSTQNIQLIGLDNIGTGPGQLSGTIVEGNGFGQRISGTAAPLVPGNPIGGIIVKGGKNPGGQMFVQTTTDANGNYTLTGIPISTGSEDYFVFVDIPGLDTNLTYHPIITSGNPIITDLDFYVDSIYINPVYVTKVKEESALFENKIALYPNPANAYFSIQYELISDSNVAIELYDMLGKKVSTLVPNGKQSKNKYNYRIETEDLNSGVYFVKLNLNGKDTTIKLILTK